MTLIYSKTLSPIRNLVKISSLPRKRPVKIIPTYYPIERISRILIVIVIVIVLVLVLVLVLVYPVALVRYDVV